VTLTIDRPMQFAAERALTARVEQTGAKGGVVVLGRPKTGEILAMASVVRTETGEVRVGSLNQAVIPYEPGSVMKAFTAAAAFESGAVNSNTYFDVPSSIRLFDRTVRDAHSHKTSSMSVNDIIAESSNVGTILMAQRVEQQSSVKTLIDNLERFGFGKKTAMNLTYEEPGTVKQRWNGTDIASIPIGQSIMATPVQIWAGYGAIANGGIYVEPRVVRDIVDAEGKHTAPELPPSRRILSSSAAASVTTALQRVVEEGTGKDWQIPGYSVAAKTGTAWKVWYKGTYGNAAVGRKYAATFAGFFPAEKPEISMVVMIDEPKPPMHYGATAAGPVFDALAKEAVRRYGIASDSDSRPTGPVRAQPALPPTTTTTTTTTTPAPATTTPPAGGASAPAPPALIARVSVPASSGAASGTAATSAAPATSPPATTTTSPLKGSPGAPALPDGEPLPGEAVATARSAADVESP
jgi:cell division protein FtsI (penicillin-binding protein 3)